MIDTPCGVIEYQEAGAGVLLLAVHGSGGSFDQGMDFAVPLVTGGVRIIATSRFGYLRTPMPADASAEAQADRTHRKGVCRHDPCLCAANGHPADPDRLARGPAAAQSGRILDARAGRRLGDLCRRTVWHLGVSAVVGILPFAQLGRGAGWFLWHSLGAVAMRVIIVRRFEAAGRHVMIAVVFHAMINLIWAVFPVQGSAYDPFVTFLILSPIATIAALFGALGTRVGAVADSSRPTTGDPQ